MSRQAGAKTIEGRRPPDRHAQFRYIDERARHGDTVAPSPEAVDVAFPRGVMTEMRQPFTQRVSAMVGTEYISREVHSREIRRKLRGRIMLLSHSRTCDVPHAYGARQHTPSVPTDRDRGIIARPCVLIDEKLH
ncbi:hypothetical protein ACWC4C_22735 [Streptomyces olivaceoviridis]